MSSLGFDDARATLDFISDNLVDAALSLAVYKSTHNDLGRFKDKFPDELFSENGTKLILRHITIIAQQNAALTICRVLEPKKENHHFDRLINFFEKNKKVLSRGNLNEFEKSILKLTDKLKSIRKSDKYRSIEALRNDTLAHADPNRRQRRLSGEPEKIVTIGAVQDIFTLSIELLNFACEMLSYGVDERHWNIYYFAEKHADQFWAKFLD